MYQESLEDLGLSPNEARIYEALLERGGLTVSELAAASSVHRRNVYDTLDRLVDKGLCTQIFSTKEHRYNAVDPDKLLEFLAEKKQQLEDILPDLKKKFIDRRPTEEAYIYEGLEGQKNIWRDVLRVGKTSYFIGAKGGWFDERLTSSRKGFLKEAKRRGIAFRQLFDAQALVERPDIIDEIAADHDYRVLPQGFDTNSAIHIFGDYVVTYTGMRIGGIDEHTTFFVMRSARLAESYRCWFRFMWKAADNHRSKPSVDEQKAYV